MYNKLFLLNLVNLLPKSTHQKKPLKQKPHKHCIGAISELCVPEIDEKRNVLGV